MDEGCALRHTGAQHVPMKVGCDAGGGGIETDVKAGLVQAELAGDILNCQNHRGEQRAVEGKRVEQGGDVLLGDDDDVDLRLRAGMAEG